MHVPFVMRRSLAGKAGSLLLGLILILAPVVGKAQNNSSAMVAAGSDFEARKTAVAQKFHRGAVREAARDLRQFVNETGDKAAKTYLLRDLAEICNVAYDDVCVLAAVDEALKGAESDASLKSLTPDILASLVAIGAWRNNPAEMIPLLKTSLPAFNAATHPMATALGYLAAARFLLRHGQHRMVEDMTSVAVLALLQMSPLDGYGISRILVDLLDSMISQQDLVGAQSLVSITYPHLGRRLGREDPYRIKYIDLVGQLSAMTLRYKSAETNLAEAELLNARLDINDDTRMSRLAVDNGLRSLMLAMESQGDAARQVHAQHPLQPGKKDIIRRGSFDTIRELYFATSDVLMLSRVDNGSGAIPWTPIFEQQFPQRWSLSETEARDAESYRDFARGLLAMLQSKGEGAVLLRRAAQGRIDNFDAALRARSEGFQLPSVIDTIMVGAAGAVSDSAQHDLMLQGSEMVLRTLRHQLSDFALLLGAQRTDQARDAARSYQLGLAEKRNFELLQIKALLEGQPRDLGAVLRQYAELRGSFVRLRDELAARSDYAATSGLPSVKQVQDALGDNEVFVTYLPTLRGIGRLCVSKTTSVNSFGPMELQQLTVDTKLLRLALTADDAADDERDAQFPAIAAVRLGRHLFEGLDRCMTKGAHVNVALPLDMAGIPLAALLAEVPPRRGDGYDLKAARWLGNDYSFSVTVSARHLLGLKRAVAHQQAPRPYFGIGDPDLAPPPAATTVAAAGQTVFRDASQNRLQDLPPLPETAEELSAVRTLLGVDAQEVLTGQAATEQAFRSKDLGAYDVIHFATHGLLKDEVDGLTEPALVLTPKDSVNTSDDGLLSTSEITHLALNARLVVLSACNTAKIDTAAASLGVNDLQAAFSVAGVPALLAALWPVESGTARDLMTGFFQAWQRQPAKSASRALAEATRGYLAHADRAHQHPRFWAPFVVMGYGDTLPGRQ